jgi:hypothetical protein
MLTEAVVAEREDLRGPRRAGEEFARHHRHECTGDLLHVISSVDHVTVRRCLRVTLLKFGMTPSDRTLEDLLSITYTSQQAPESKGDLLNAPIQVTAGCISEMFIFAM